MTKTLHVKGSFGGVTLQWEMGIVIYFWDHFMQGWIKKNQGFFWADREPLKDFVRKYYLIYPEEDPFS